MNLKDAIKSSLYGVYLQGRHDGESPYLTEEREEKDFEQDANSILDHPQMKEKQDKAKKWDSMFIKCDICEESFHAQKGLDTFNCPVCGGYKAQLDSIRSIFEVGEKCHKCKSKGQVPYTHEHEDSVHYRNCSECDGTGYITREVKIEEVVEVLEDPGKWSYSDFKWSYILQSGANLKMKEKGDRK